MRLSPKLLQSTSRDVQNSFIEIRQFLVLGFLCLSIMGLLAAPVPTGQPSTYPAWWFSRGVIPLLNSTNTSPTWPASYPVSDDYAAINQGQLKSMAMQAYNELAAKAPSYVWSTTYGINLTSMVSSWTPTSGDAYATVNLGQLKTVSVAFYNVLVQMGYSTTYPWNGINPDDYSTANIGQAKNAFSFNVGLDSDGNGLPDWWEKKYFGQLGNIASSSPDGNGLTLLQDYQQGNNPTSYYSQNGSNIVPVLTLVSGNNQTNNSGTFAPNPLIVRVTNSNNVALTNAPVSYVLVAGGGSIAATNGGTSRSNLATYTDGSGYAQVFYDQPSTANVTGTVSASTGGQTVNFNETSSFAGVPPPPVNLSVSYGSTSATLNWTDPGSGIGNFIIQSSTDGGITWSTLATVPGTATSTTVTGLTLGANYSFRIVASNGSGSSAPSTADAPPILTLTAPAGATLVP